MADYEKMYFTLFRAITDAIEYIDETNYGTARAVLIEAQQLAEEIYIETAEESE